MTDGCGADCTDLAHNCKPFNNQIGLTLKKKTKMSSLSKTHCEVEIWGKSVFGSFNDADNISLAQKYKLIIFGGSSSCSSSKD